MSRPTYTPGQLVRMAKPLPYGPGTGAAVRLLGLARPRVWAVGAELYGALNEYGYRAWRVYEVQLHMLGEVLPEVQS